MEGDWIGGRDLWKEKARALKLRFRDRFRIAVDKHWNRKRFSDSLNSSTSRRWILRLRKISTGSSQPPVFYRKRVNKDVNIIEDSTIVRMLQSLAVPVIGNACHVFMHGLNQIQIYGAEKLHQALLQRPEGKPLITVSNHVASMDDPLVIASLLPPTILLNASNLRWTLCASDRCFRNSVTSAFFQCVKVLPVTRGEGLYQKGMDMALSKLNNGGWVHIFPEGSRSRDGGRTMGSVKRGIGRLVMDADNIPLVVPFVHTGMQEVMPIGSSFPKIGKKVTVLIGDPILFDDLLLIPDEYHNVSRADVYDVVSSRVGCRLHELKIQVDKLALEEALPVRECTLKNTDRANVILQQVDWDGFGTGNYVFSEEDSPPWKPVIQTQPNEHLGQIHQPSPSNWNVSMGFTYEGGIVSRLRGYMNPNELRGFAARGLFMNGRTWRENRINIREGGPLKAWKQFLEANMFQQWGGM